MTFAEFLVLLLLAAAVGLIAKALIGYPAAAGCSRSRSGSSER